MYERVRFPQTCSRSMVGVPFSMDEDRLIYCAEVSEHIESYRAIRCYFNVVEVGTNPLCSRITRGSTPPSAARAGTSTPNFGWLCQKLCQTALQAEVTTLLSPPLCDEHIFVSSLVGRPHLCHQPCLITTHLSPSPALSDDHTFVSSIYNPRFYIV